MIEDYSRLQEHQNKDVVLYLRATTDPEAHLKLNAQINSLAAITLIDSEATGVFITLCTQILLKNVGRR